MSKEKKFFDSNTTYYEREWRITELNLATCEQLKMSNPRHRLIAEGYPRQAKYGKLLIREKTKFFQFENEMVAFLIAPQEYIDRIDNPHGFEIKTYEDITSGS